MPGDSTSGIFLISIVLFTYGWRIWRPQWISFGP